MNRTEPVDAIERRVRHSFNPERSGDVILVFKPYYLEAPSPFGTSHGSPYEYDSHVPLIFIGPAVKADRYNEVVATVDIAPTLAEILRVKPLNPIDGHARKEILK
ncbi:MAG: hypothetical protein HY314_15730 [Acidobacteria bacterium]|nr:hypothetical protein [Acidobacteriota bacterium]